MSKFKNDGLDQYCAEPFVQQQLGSSGVEGFNMYHLTVYSWWFVINWWRLLCCHHMMLLSCWARAMCRERLLASWCHVLSV